MMGLGFLDGLGYAAVLAGGRIGTDSEAISHFKGSIKKGRHWAAFSLRALPQAPYSGVAAGSARRCSRSAAAWAKRSNSARRLAGAMRCSSASRTISAP